MLSATKKSRRCFSRVAKQKTKPPDLCPLAIRAAIAILFSPLFRRPDFEKNFAAKSSRLSSTPRFRAASIKRSNCAGSVLFARFFCFVSAFATTTSPVPAGSTDGETGGFWGHVREVSPSAPSIPIDDRWFRRVCKSAAAVTLSSIESLLCRLLAKAGRPFLLLWGRCEGTALTVQ